MCICPGPLFKKKYLNAKAQAKVHEDKLVFLNQRLPDNVRNTWTTMIEEWEKDRTKPNPYYTPSEGMPSATGQKSALTLHPTQQVRLRRIFRSALPWKRKKNSRDLRSLSQTLGARGQLPSGYMVSSL